MQDLRFEVLTFKNLTNLNFHPCICSKLVSHAMQGSPPLNIFRIDPHVPVLCVPPRDNLGDSLLLCFVIISQHESRPFKAVRVGVCLHLANMYTSFDFYIDLHHLIKFKYD